MKWPKKPIRIGWSEGFSASAGVETVFRPFPPSIFRRKKMYKFLIVSYKYECTLDEPILVILIDLLFVELVASLTNKQSLHRFNLGF